MEVTWTLWCEGGRQAENRAPQSCSQPEPVQTAHWSLELPSYPFLLPHEPDQAPTSTAADSLPPQVLVSPPVQTNGKLRCKADEKPVTQHTREPASRLGPCKIPALLSPAGICQPLSWALGISRPHIALTSAEATNKDTTERAKKYEQHPPSF